MNDHALQHIDRDSFVHRMDALSKSVWLMCVAVAMLTFDSILSGLVMLVVLLFLTLVLAQVPLKRLSQASPSIFGIAVVIGLFHSLVNPGRPVLSLGIATVTDRGIVIGIGYFFRMAVVVLSSYVFIWTTDIHDLMAGLVSVGLSYRVAFAVFIALRFLPIMQAEVDAVKAAHAIRGSSAKQSLKRRYELWQRYLFTILVNGLRKAESAAAAVDCRGFGRYPVRTFIKPFRWTGSGIAMVFTFLLLAVFLHWLERQGVGISLFAA
jgi:energy-coupling factor transport system permease protein